jgi:hypothetical protein
MQGLQKSQPSPTLLNPYPQPLGGCNTPDFHYSQPPSLVTWPNSDLKQKNSQQFFDWYLSKLYSGVRWDNVVAESIWAFGHPCWLLQTVMPTLIKWWMSRRVCSSICGSSWTRFKTLDVFLAICSQVSGEMWYREYFHQHYLWYRPMAWFVYRGQNYPKKTYSQWPQWCGVQSWNKCVRSSWSTLARHSSATLPP